MISIIRHPLIVLLASVKICWTNNLRIFINIHPHHIYRLLNGILNWNPRRIHVHLIKVWSLVIIVITSLTVTWVVRVLLPKILILHWKCHLRNWNFCVDRLAQPINRSTVSRVLVCLCFISLRGIVHLYLPSEQLSTIHFMKGAFGLLFWQKFYESKSFWGSRNRVNNDLSLKNWGIDLLESLQQQGIVDCRVQITNVDLESFHILSIHLIHTLVRNILLLLNLAPAIEIVRNQRSWLNFVHLHLVDYRDCSTSGSGHSPSMWCPVKFKVPIYGSRDSLSV